MGSAPKSEVTRERRRKWAVQVNYRHNGLRSSTLLKGLDYPTENEVIKALYNFYGHWSNNEFTDIEIYNKYSYIE